MSALLGALRGVASRVRRLMLPHDGRDNSSYWRGRAQAQGSAAVLWTNVAYNRLVREREFEIIGPVLAALPPSPSVLDIGCGIGEITRWLLAQRPDVRVTGVDFPEMVERAAREIPTADGVEWIGSSADEFDRPAHFDLVLSSGCYSAIRDRAKCERAIALGCKAVRPGGVLLMIDPFHRSKYLARVRMDRHEVRALVERQGLEVERSGGILFWPMRELLANSTAEETVQRRWFEVGERWLARLGEETWSDYKVLQFRRPAMPEAATAVGLPAAVVTDAATGHRDGPW